MVTFRVYYETQVKKRPFVPSQPDSWLDIMIMYVTCAVARAAAGHACLYSFRLDLLIGLAWVDGVL